MCANSTSNLPCARIITNINATRHVGGTLHTLDARHREHPPPPPRRHALWDGSTSAPAQATSEFGSDERARARSGHAAAEPSGNYTDAHSSQDTRTGNGACMMTNHRRTNQSHKAHTPKRNAHGATTQTNVTRAPKYNSDSRGSSDEGSQDSAYATLRSLTQDRHLWRQHHLRRLATAVLSGLWPHITRPSVRGDPQARGRRRGATVSTDRYDLDYACGDCGRDDHTSLSSMMLCNCDRYDRNGNEKESA